MNALKERVNDSNFLTVPEGLELYRWIQTTFLDGHAVVVPVRQYLSMVDPADEAPQPKADAMEHVEVRPVVRFTWRKWRLGLGWDQDERVAVLWRE